MMLRIISKQLVMEKQEKYFVDNNGFIDTDSLVKAMDQYSGPYDLSSHEKEVMYNEENYLELSSRINNLPPKSLTELEQDYYNFIIE